MVILPSTQLVEKKAMLRVSRGLSWVQSADLVWGSDSPVRDELSTWTEKEKTIWHVRGADEEEEEDNGVSNWLSAFMIRYKARQRDRLGVF